MHKLFAPLISLLLLAGCDSAHFSDKRISELESTDAIFTQLSSNATATGIRELFSVDHSRLAEDSDEVLDASKVSFYSNPENDSQILKKEIRAGLDLPYRIQAYYHQKEPRVIYTSVDFIKIRHGLDNSAVIEKFDQDIASLVTAIPGAIPLAHNNLVQDYGIIELESELSFEQTVDRLKSTILAEGDTIWFHDIDYQQQARGYGISLPSSKLLVFGAPAPGAKAMRDYPSIGLDAFPQKVLVYEQNGKVLVIYNEIPGIARLHYDDTALAHRVIAYRLKNTLSSAITGND